MRSNSRLHLLLGILLFAAGCGEQPKIAPARGIVKISGQPMTVGRIMFVPVEQAHQNSKKCPAAFADIQSDGAFVLGTFGEGDGAVIGQHRVTIFSKNSKQEDLLAKYKDGAKKKDRTEKKPPFDQIRLVSRTFEVFAGKENEFIIDLTKDEINRYGEK